MASNTNSLKENIAGTILTKKERNIMLDLNQSENGSVKELESLKLKWMNEQLQ